MAFEKGGDGKMANYRINISQAKNQAKAINQQAEALQAEKRALKSLQDQIRVVWKTEAAEILINKNEVLIENIQRTQQKMTELGNTIRNTADKIQREDEKKAKIAANAKR